jgi:transcriptional regulator NrdR family protein
MRCPNCNSKSKILETRINDDNTKRRRYECFTGHRFSSKEIISMDNPHTERKPVLKKIVPDLVTLWS